MSSPEVAAALAELQAGHAADGQALVAWAEAHTRTGETIARLVDLLGATPDPEPDVELVATEITSSTVTVTWSTDRNDVASWTVGRDGSDTLGSGPWSTPTPLPGSARSFTFRSLRAGTEYRLTVTPSGGEPAQLAVTTKPAAGGGQPGARTAAERYGWGKPDPISDEFDDYTGQPDPMRWILPGPDWKGHEGRGRRRPERTTVRDGMMVLSALANGDAAWVRQRRATRYGRWEIRSRSRNTTSSGTPYHVLALIWPSLENWPRSGEYDWLETEDPGQDFYRAYLHYPHPTAPPVQQEIITIPRVDQTQWHCYGFEWAPDRLAGFIDGEQVWQLTGGAGPAGRSAIQAMPEGSLTLQIDHFHSTRECVLEVDWVRFWPLPRELL